MKSKPILLILLLAAAAFLSGCVNLAAVRDVAKQAETLTAHNGIPKYFVDSPVRRQSLYSAEPVSADDMSAAKASRESFEKKQAVLAKYFAMLATLADKDAISYQKNLDGLVASASAAGALDKADGEVFASVANILLRTFTDGARHRHLRSIVERCDPAVKNVTVSMAVALRDGYGDLLSQEVAAHASFDRAMKTADSTALQRLAGYVTRELKAQEEKRSQAAETYAAALEKIAAVHHTLATNLTDFTRKELVAQLREYEDDLKTLKAKLAP